MSLTIIPKNIGTYKLLIRGFFLLTIFYKKPIYRDMPVQCNVSWNKACIAYIHCLTRLTFFNIQRNNFSHIQQFSTFDRSLLFCFYLLRHIFSLWKPMGLHKCCIIFYYKLIVQYVPEKMRFRWPEIAAPYMAFYLLWVASIYFILALFNILCIIFCDKVFLDSRCQILHCMFHL